jgi:exosortase E/protease (VPEID-CTERM system)
VLIDLRKELPAQLLAPSLGARLGVAAGLLLLEKVVLNLFVDFDRARAALGLGAAVRVAQHWGFRCLVSFAIAAAVFAYMRGGRELQDAAGEVRAAPVRARWLLVHIGLVLPLMPLSASLYGSATRLPLAVVVLLWVLLAVLAVAALLKAFAPWEAWRSVARSLGALWWYAAFAAAGAVLTMAWSQRLWRGMARITFEAVSRLLLWIVPGLQVDPAHLVIDTGHFAVFIDPVCSGLEGMGLVLAFCTALLLLFRREYVFPRALILIPVGIALSFVLNIARIAALVMIGDAGYSGVAVYGFHSQAGWIAFNGIAAGIALVSLRSPWLTCTASRERTEGAAENPTAVYLLPFMALLLAGMVSRAMSSGFESLYWLRLIAVGVALSYSYPRLRGLDWRFGWRGVAAGLAAFAVWGIAAELFVHQASMPPGLAALQPPTPASWWIVLHLLTSLAALPLAEELAFRGYLLRRLQSAEFESVAPRSVGAWPLLLSSVIFGVCNGPLWFPGTLTGVIFGLVYVRTQRIGEAVAAHVTANALAASAALIGPQWQLW